MTTILRTIAGFFAGMLAASILVVAVEFFSAVVHPLPADFGGTQEEMCEHVARYPQWVLAVVVPAWAGAALVSTWIASRVGNWGVALALGLLIVAALVLNLSMLPYPIWFKVACLIAIPGAIVFVLIKSGRRRESALGSMPGSGGAIADESRS